MPSEFARHWTLDPTVTFLNHGSYGAAPRDVLAAQQAWRDRIEAEPVRFFENLEADLDEARRALGAFVGANPDDLAFVPNATAGINAVLRSLRFRAGDELLTTDHEYNAVKNAMEYIAERDGARVVIAPGIHRPTWRCRRRSASVKSCSQGVGMPSASATMRW